MGRKLSWETESSDGIVTGIGGMIFLPYLAGERTPLMNPDAKGVFFGMSLEHTGAHMTRAVMEGVTYALRDSLEILEEMGISVTLVNVRFVKPFDRELLKKLSETHSVFVTMEENVRTGGFGQQVLDYAEEEKLPVTVSIAAVPDTFVSHGSVEWQRKQVGLDTDSILERIEKLRTGQENRT